MAAIVAGFGMPHNPGAPALAAREGPQGETARHYAEMAKHLKAIAPDVLIIFTDDHFNTFFLDNFPTFAIGIADTTSGPNDQTPMPRYEVAVPGDLATHIRNAAIAHGFDISLVQDFEVDHAIMVPLHFLTPHMRIPVLPIFINCLAPPLPSAQRCYALGEAVRDAVASWPQPLRVAAIGSGSFSLEIGGPKIPVGNRAACTPDPEWAQHVQELSVKGRIDDLIGEATTARMLQAGNIGGELLNWIAMLGVIGTRKPHYMHAAKRSRPCLWAWRLELRGQAMSVYAINKICRDALHDLAFREALKRDPAAAIAARDLTDEERKALLAGDVPRLYEQGCHPFLMSYLTRWDLFGLSPAVYTKRIQNAHDARD